jgi:TRAP-type C4-dicarboxylate transport system substrate-binding protein
MKRLSIAMFLASALSVSAAHAEEVRLRGVAALPATTEFTRRFQAFVDLVNETGKGVVQIDVIGGPEAIPPTQQDTALRNGVVDVQSGPAGYYAGTVPESGAFKGATVDASTVRGNGAWDYLADVWKERLDAKLLAWIGGGVQFYIYLGKEPKFTEAGDLDVKGLKLRSAPPYRDWFDGLGATNVMLGLSEVYTAMERGVVDGYGNTVFNSDLGTNKLVNSRVGPGVWQNDVMIMVNEGKWESLSADAQKILGDAALQIEADNVAYYRARVVDENARIAADGITIVELEGEAGVRHVNNAHKVVWDKLANDAPESAQKLRPLMYPDQ